MNKFEKGYKEAAGEIISGFITPLIINAFANTGLLPWYFVTMLSLIVIGENIVFILSMSSWGILYTLGWLFGAYIFYTSGLLGILDVILYIVIPIVFLIIRFVIWFRNQS